MKALEKLFLETEDDSRFIGEVLPSALHQGGNSAQPEVMLFAMILTKLFLKVLNRQFSTKDRLQILSINV